MSTMFYTALSVLLFSAIIQNVSALYCWSCNSGSDYACHDYFNVSRSQIIHGGRFGGGYDPNYNNPNYGNSQGYGNTQEYANSPNTYVGGKYQDDYSGHDRGVRSTLCSQTGALKAVCVKRKMMYNGREVIARACDSVDFNTPMGNCNDPRYPVCEYCDTDNCNGATGLKGNLALGGSLLSAGLLFLYTRVFC